MSEETVKPKPENNNRTVELPKGLQRGLQGLLYRVRDSVVPEIHYFEGETANLVIRMAPYRKQIPVYMVYGGIAGFLLSWAAYFTGQRIQWPDAYQQWSATYQLITGLLILAFLYLTAKGGEDWLLYEQWQFILTDKRLILVTPDPNHRGFADAIYLQKSKIQVLDTNWSKSPLWGLFQATQGSRDVMLSMSGYEFKEEGAQVKGGLRFPDVLPEDIKKLEVLIFG